MVEEEAEEIGWEARQAQPSTPTPTLSEAFSKLGATPWKLRNFQIMPQAVDFGSL